MIAGPKAHRTTYRQFPPGFFDPIATDECHRGSAADDLARREIPAFFSPATRIDLTATPKETKYVSNIACFGEPARSCSLKQGVRDGLLAPCKAVKVGIDRYVEGYWLEQHQFDCGGRGGRGSHLMGL